MGEARRKMLDKLAKLEGEGLWLVAESHAEGELLRRLRAQGEVVSPCRGVYARAESYRAATCRIRTYRLIRALGRALGVLLLFSGGYARASSALCAA